VDSESWCVYGVLSSRRDDPLLVVLAYTEVRMSLVFLLLFADIRATSIRLETLI
jgi:hypothetical protein